MIRRSFLVAAVAGVLAPFAAEAQQAGKVAHVGILSSSYPSVSASQPSWWGFEEGLRDLGWSVGRDLVLERRYAEGQLDRLPGLAQDLVRLNVDVLVTFGPLTIKPALEATRDVPIVMIGATDPVRDGFVTSLARPGGNVTGVTWGVGSDPQGKLLEILKTVLPRASRVTILTEGPLTPTSDEVLTDAARRLSLRLERSVVQDRTELEQTIAAIRRQGTHAVFLTMAGLLFTERNRVATLAVAHRLPTFGLFRELPEAGGLFSYGQNIGNLYRRGATFVDRILKGAKPGDLPIEQATKLELVINLKTAKALGLTIPPSLLLRADQLIE
jgi:putative ABC transport system substrate-binding protein